MSFSSFFGRMLLACVLPVFVMLAMLGYTAGAIEQTGIPMPDPGGFFGVLFVLALVWSFHFYPDESTVRVRFEGGFKDANWAMSNTFKIAFALVVLMAVPEGLRAFRAACLNAGVEPGVSVPAGVVFAAIWQYCNQLWYRLLWPGILSVPIGFGLAVRALMKDAEKQRKSSQDPRISL